MSLTGLSPSFPLPLLLPFPFLPPVPLPFPSLLPRAAQHQIIYPFFQIFNCVVKSNEILRLYHRFQQLDRNKSGTVSMDELYAIPEVEFLSSLLLSFLPCLSLSLCLSYSLSLPLCHFLSLSLSLSLFHSALSLLSSLSNSRQQF